MVKIFYFYSDFVQAVDNWRNKNLSRDGGGALNNFSWFDELFCTRDNERAAKEAITNFNPN